MNTVRDIGAVRSAVRRARERGATIGLVPTMGALHEGHLSLIRQAAAECGEVVVSLFVNPAQFNEAADLDRYPRDEARDAALAAEAGAHLLFAPAVPEIYPEGFATTIRIGGPITETLEGIHRGAAHFDGVATVVAKLFNIVQPDVAYFGQKDAQQALVIRKLVADLDFPVRVEVCATQREPDGLALSSRNVHLAPAERAQAVALPRALEAARAAIAAGERDAAVVRARAVAELQALSVEPEYLELVEPRTLAPVTAINGEVLVAVAARVGETRLIDNTLIQTTDPLGRRS